MALTAKHQLFASEYLKDLNATQAAIRAGYSRKTAKVQGSRLLTNADIKAAIDAGNLKRQEKTGVTAASVLARLNDVADRCMQAKPVMVFDKVAKEMVQAYDDEDRAVYEFDSTGANRALELLGRHLKLFTDKLEITADQDLAKLLAEGRARAAAGVPE